jgi:hypothetical protein
VGERVATDRGILVETMGSTSPDEEPVDHEDLGEVTWPLVDAIARIELSL